MRKLLSVVLVLVLSGGLVADESGDRLRAAVERQRAEEVAHLSEIATSLAKQRNPARAIHLKACRARIDALTAKRVDPLPIINPFHLAVGDVGMLGKMDTGVYPEDARQMENMERRVLEVADYRVIQVLDKTSLLLSIEDPKFKQDGSIVILEGIDTADVVDGTKLAMDRLYEVAGTRSYVSVLGATKKVLVLRVFKR